MPESKYGDSKADYLQRVPYSKRALLEESMINAACVFKVLQSCGVGMACRKDVTKLFIKRTVFQSRSFRCGSHTFEATKQQQVRDARMSRHNCNTFRNITLTNSNKFIHIVTRRHNTSVKPHTLLIAIVVGLLRDTMVCPMK